MSTIGGIDAAASLKPRGCLRNDDDPGKQHLCLDRHRLQRLDSVDAFDQERLVLGAAVDFASRRRRNSGIASAEPLNSRPSRM